MTNTRGEGNVLITPDIVAREYLMRLMESLVIPRLASFDYRGYFEGAIGNKITIKRPYYAFLSSGRELKDAQINPMVDDTVTLSVDNRYKGALKWNDVEKTLDINQFSQRYLDALVEQHGIQFDQDGGAALSEGGFMVHKTIGASLTQDVVPDIRAYALEASIPLGRNTFGLMNPVDSAQVQKDLSGARGASGKFNERLVAQNIRESFIGSLSRYMMFETNDIEDMTVPAKNAGTVAIDVAPTEGAAQITTDGWGNAVGKVLNKGNLIQIAGVNQTYVRLRKNDYDSATGLDSGKRDMGRPMTFTVTADVSCDNTGHATIPISPALNAGAATATDSEGNSVSLKAFQNITALPANDAAITVIGRANNAVRTYRQNIFFNRKALHYVPVQLSQLTDGSGLEQYQTMDPQTNVSITATHFSDGKKMEEIVRLDTLYGVKVIYPDLMIRHISTRR